MRTYLRSKCAVFILSVLISSPIFNQIFPQTAMQSTAFASPISTPVKPPVVSRKYPDLNTSYTAVNINPWVYGLTPFTARPWQNESGDWWIVHYSGNATVSTSGIRFRTPAGTRCVIIDWFGPRCVKYMYGKGFRKVSVIAPSARNTVGTNPGKIESKNSAEVIGCREAKIEFILFHNEKTPGAISTLSRQHCDAIYHPGTPLFYNDNYLLIPAGHKISIYNVTCAVTVDDRITCLNSFHHGFVFAEGHDQTF